jgi:hypothetical protein
MATITEAFDSRSGDERGVAGTFAVRQFIVDTDAAGDDPITVILADTDTNVAIGTLHPDSNYPIFVTKHRKSRRLTATAWLVDVVYGTDLGQIGDSLSHPDYPGWTVRVSAMTQQEQQTHSIAVQIEDGPDEPIKLIGTQGYEPAKETDQNAVYYNVTERDALGQEFTFKKWLAPTGTVRKPLPQTTLSAKSALSLVKSFSTFDYVLTDPGWLSSLVGLINSDQFMGLAPGTCKFIFWSIDVTPGNTVDGTTGNRFNVQLDFELDFTRITDINKLRRHQRILVGHSPVQLAMTWKNENDEEVPLRETGVLNSGEFGVDDRVLENFHLTERFDIGAMISTIEAIHGN